MLNAIDYGIKCLSFDWMFSTRKHQTRDESRPEQNIKYHDISYFPEMEIKHPMPTVLNTINDCYLLLKTLTSTQKF